MYRSAWLAPQTRVLSILGLALQPFPSQGSYLVALPTVPANQETYPELPGSKQFSDTETGAEAKSLGVLQSLLPLN